MIPLRRTLSSLHQPSLPLVAVLTVLGLALVSLACAPSDADANMAADLEANPAAAADGPAQKGRASSSKGPSSKGPSSKGPNTDAWQRVLDAHARDGGLDYAGLAKDRSDLHAYLESITDLEVGNLSQDEQLAFWSNAYNAVTVHHVLERYPGISSVNDVDGFFDRLTYRVAGERLTLNEIEERGRDLGDPRIHFAVVCASTSCPALDDKAFRAQGLDEHLERLTRAFLADPEKGLRIDEKAKKAHLSSIFKWYAGDFTGGSTVVAYFDRDEVLNWVVAHAPKQQAETLKRLEPSVSYLDYDWSLNDR